MANVDPIISEAYSNLLAELQAHFMTHGGVTLPVQLLKLQEEVGEVAEAFIGATGANPRKGTTHSMEHVAMELADVALVAMLAIRFTGCDVNRTLQLQADRTRMRLDEFDARLEEGRV
jgi:NTP pyrophosphatase (non-canonical NTP hydrolase)